MLEKLITGLNFSNIFIRSFYACNSQKRKNSFKSSVSFYALGSTGAKAARRTLEKLTPGVHVEKMLCKIDKRCLRSCCNALCPARLLPVVDFSPTFYKLLCWQFHFDKTYKHKGSSIFLCHGHRGYHRYCEECI